MGWCGGLCADDVAPGPAHYAVFPGLSWAAGWLWRIGRVLPPNKVVDPMQSAYVFDVAFPGETGPTFMGQLREFTI